VKSLKQLEKGEKCKRKNFIRHGSYHLFNKLILIQKRELRYAQWPLKMIKLRTLKANGTNVAATAD
jgi:hypothetical protein